MPDAVKPAVPLVAKPAVPVVAAKPVAAAPVVAKPAPVASKASVKGEIEAELKLLKDPNRTSDMHRISAEKIEKLLAAL